jgi:sulfur carrier protein
MDAIATNQIHVVVNGQPRQVPPGKTLLELLTWLEVDPSRVAVELNRSIVRREDWGKTPINAGAALEIVQFVGGG